MLMISLSASVSRRVDEHPKDQCLMSQSPNGGDRRPCTPSTSPEPIWTNMGRVKVVKGAEHCRTEDAKCTRLNAETDLKNYYFVTHSQQIESSAAGGGMRQKKRQKSSHRAKLIAMIMISLSSSVGRRIHEHPKDQCLMRQSPNGGDWRPCTT